MTEERTTYTDTDGRRVTHTTLGPFRVTIRTRGRKTEGDGRTAADLRREREEKEAR